MKRKVNILMALMVIVAAMVLYHQILSDETISVSFMDIGQGDAILVRQGNFDILIDGGPDLTVLRRLGEKRPAWDRKIDLIILTHPDQDHLGGIIYVLNKYEVGAVIAPRVIDKTKNYNLFLRQIKDNKIPLVFAEAGQTISHDKLVLNIISPDEKLLEWGKTNINNASVVAKLFLPGYSLLLTGDIEAPVENYLANKFKTALKADILKVGHHGSKTSSTASLLDFVKPRMAIISVGAKNMFGHPHESVIKRLNGAKIERTDRMGTVTLKSDVASGEVGLRCEKDCAL